MRQQSTAKGFAILSAAGMIVKIISLLYVPFLTRIITIEGYGIYSVVYQVFAFVYVITNSGIPVAISKMVSELKAQGNHKDALKTFKIARGILIGLGLITSLLLFAMAGPISAITNNKEAYLGIIALSPTVFITSVMSAYRGYFQGNGNMTPTAISQVAEQIINTIFSLLFAAMLIGKSLELGVVGSTIGTTLGALVAFIYLVIIYKKDKTHTSQCLHNEPGVRRLSNKAIFRRLFNYCVPITLSVGLQNAGTLIDAANINARLAVSGFESSIAKQKFGLYGLHTTMIRVPITLISALSAASLPSIAAASAVDDIKLVKEKINYAFRLCAIVAAPSVVGLAVLSRPMYEILFPKGVEGYVLLTYGAISVLLMAFVQIQVTILQSIGKLYSALIAIGIGIIAKIVTNFILVAIPDINIMGAVYANIIYYIIPMMINMHTIRKVLRLKFKLRRYIIKPLISSLLMGIAIFIVYYGLERVLSGVQGVLLIKAILLAITIAIGGLVYAYALILTGGFTSTDLEALPNRIRKLIPKLIKKVEIK